jgi:hypothetical protein
MSAHGVVQRTTFLGIRTWKVIYYCPFLQNSRVGRLSFPCHFDPILDRQLTDLSYINALGKHLCKSKAAFVHAMKAYGELEVHLHTFLTLSLSKPIPKQVYYKPIGFQEVEALRFLDKR